MSLRSIVAALGGDLYDGGRRASVPAPGHSRRDRSVSLLLSGGRVVVHSFGAADWREVLADLRTRKLIDALGAPQPVAADGPTHRPPPRDRDRLRAAGALWAGAGPIGPATVSARHLRTRGVREPPAGADAMRHHPAAPVSVYREGGPALPALLAAVCDRQGALTAVEVTYLGPSGRRASTLRLPRKAVGLIPPGSAVRLAPADPELLVGEGVFTTLSAMERFGLPGWALLSTSNLRTWWAPDGVRRVLIAADRGEDGQRSARRLAVRLREAGLAVRLRTPPPPFGDWNEAATAGDEARSKGEVGRVGAEWSAAAAGEPP